MKRISDKELEKMHRVVSHGMDMLAPEAARVTADLRETRLLLAELVGTVILLGHDAGFVKSCPQTAKKIDETLSKIDSYMKGSP